MCPIIGVIQQTESILKASDYKQKRPELTLQRRYMLAHYDNAVLYNDSIVNQIVKRFCQ